MLQQLFVMKDSRVYFIEKRMTSIKGIIDP